MNELIFLVEDSPEGGYEAKALSASSFTEADTIDELRLMIKDAVECHFEPTDRPQVIRYYYPQSLPFRVDTLNHTLTDIATELNTSKDELLNQIL